MLSSGDRINKYQILGEIAQGGEAIVHRALDTFEQKDIALKVIHERNIRLEPEISKLFLREGQILAEINDPSIIKIYESNIAQVNGKEYFYHAMELVDAPTLDDWLKQNKPGWKEIIRILRAIASAVDILHSREDPILHRDLKPSNIFLLAPGDDQNPARVKIFDFGLAKCEYERTITAPDAFRGTVMYAAPECMKIGGKASAASDIFCLGRVLEQMIGDEIPDNLPRWIIDLKNIMCDPTPQNRPSAEEVVQIIDEQVEAKSRITIALTKLVTLKNRIRIQKWRRTIRALGVVIVIIIIALLGYMTYMHAKPGLKLVSITRIDDPYAVAVSGDYAYLAAGKQGLVVVDIGNRKEPRIVVPGIAIEDLAQNITINDDLAYLADGLKGVKIFDIVNPKTPTVIGKIDTDPVNIADSGAVTNDIAVSGDYAYLADDIKGIDVLSVIDPRKPEIIDSLDLAPGLKHYTYSVYISGDYLYSADGKIGLSIIDINDPRNLKLAGTAPTQRAKDVIVSGDYAFVADGESGLIVINVSNPKSPESIPGAAVDSQNESVGIALSMNYIYMADSLGGLVTVDVKNPAKPEEVDRIKIKKPFVDVGADTDYVYAVAVHDGLRIYRHQREWKWF